MSDYLTRAKDILKELSRLGCEAYIVGEGVRCEITKEEPTEIEIVALFTPSKIEQSFSDYKFEAIDNNRCIIKFGQYEYKIKTFSKSNETKKLKELKTVYSKNLKDELSNRTMTIDAISMTSTGKFTDPFGGAKDIRLKRLNPIGNVKGKVNSDPELAFKILKTYAVTNYKLHSSLLKAVKANKKTLCQLTLNDYYRDLKVILEAKKYKKLYEIMLSLNPKKNLNYIGSSLNYFMKKNERISFDDLLACQMILNAQFDSAYASLFENSDLYQKAIEVAIKYPKCDFDNVTMYNVGVESLLLANQLLVKLRKCKLMQKKIKRRFEALPIKSKDEIALSINELYEMNLDNSKIEETYDSVVIKVLEKDIENEHDVLMSYCVNCINAEQNDISTASSDTFFEKESSEKEQYQSVEKEEAPYQEKPNAYGYNFDYKEEAPKEQSEYDFSNPYALGGSVYNQKIPNRERDYLYNPDSRVTVEDKQYYADERFSQIRSDFNHYKYQQLEREISEMRKRLDERDQQFLSLQKSTLISKLRVEVEQLVQTNMAQLESLGLLNTAEEKMVYEKNQKGVYLNMLLTKPEYKVLTKEDLINEKN